MKKYLNIILSVSIIVIAVVCFVKLNAKIPKVAYVDLETIYNDFPMKKELELKLDNVQQARKLILDSLKIELNALSHSVKSEKDAEGIQKFQYKKQEYLLKQQSFDQDNQKTTENYTAQIWKQINQYIKDFGKQNNYALVVGADGSGALLYGEEKINITKEVSTYLSERYYGGQK